MKHGIMNKYFCLATLKELITGNRTGEIYLQSLHDTVGSRTKGHSY